MKKKSYLIEMEETPEGGGTIHRTNIGFSVFELIGLLESTKASLVKEFITDKKIEYEKKAGDIGAEVKIEL